jgi:two-component system phosphate regulon sensor histidine kinase PhoR
MPTVEELQSQIETLKQEKQNLKDNFKRSLLEIEDLNNKLISSEEYKSKFLSLIRNEFNNPISSILNLSKSLVKKAQDDKIKFFSECINKESLILRFQIANIIAAAELEAGLFNEEKTNIDIQEIINENLSFLDYIVVEKNLLVFKNIEVESNFIQNQEKISLILINLISNACEHSLPNGKIEINVKEDDEKVYFDVKDYGEGIDKEEVGDKLYEQFVQLHSGKTRPKMGQGLGLTIVKELVESMGGVIDYESQLTEYTVFSFFIPKVDADSCNVLYSEGVDSFFFDDDFSDDSNSF